MPVFIEIDGIKGDVKQPGQASQAEARATAPAEPAQAVKLEPVLVSSYQASGHSDHGGQMHIDSFNWGSTGPAHAGDPRHDEREVLVPVPDTIEAADWILVSRLDGVDGAPDPDLGWDIAAEPPPAAEAYADWHNYRVSVDTIE